MPIRARDVRQNIVANGFERGVVITLEAMLEEQSAMRQNIVNAVEVIQSIVEQLDRFLEIASSMQRNVDTVKRNLKGPDDEA